MVAPSFAISINISPSVPSPYSPVRKNTAWPPTLLLIVNPRRLALNVLRSTIRDNWRFNTVSLLACTRLFTSSSNSSVVNCPRSTILLFADKFTASSALASVVSSLASFSFLSLLLLNGWLSLLPSRYNAFAFKPNSQLM